jgi:PRTRC genetic system protein C
LPDPNPNLNVGEVINLYATTYPEITTAAIEGPEVIGNRLVYRLTRAIGAKG